MSNQSLFEKRYPQLSFLVYMELGYEKESRVEKKSLLGLPELSLLSQVEVVYVYGIEGALAYFHFCDWIEEKVERHVVWIEKDLREVKRAVLADWGEQWLSHPRFHLEVIWGSPRLKEFVMSCASKFPTQLIDVVASTEKRLENPLYFAELKDLLFRETTIQNALSIEKLNYHLIVKNLFSNYFHLSTSSCGNRLASLFQNVPAVICGAGPSLEKDLPTLQKLENRALVISCGSAIGALTAHAVFPHLAIAIDPNFEEYLRFIDGFGFEVPLFYVSRVHPLVFATCNGPLSYVHTLSGGRLEAWVQKKLGMNPPPFPSYCDVEGMSVTTMAVEFAYSMGCNPIILSGVDLAFVDRLPYASGVIPRPSMKIEGEAFDCRVGERVLHEKNRKGNLVRTCVKWVMERDSISRFAQKNSSVQWISSSIEGLVFPSIPHQPLSSHSFVKQIDVRGRLHAALQQRLLQVPPEKIIALFRMLQSDFQQAKHFSRMALDELVSTKEKQMDPETGKMAFAQLELEELEIFFLFFEEVIQVLSQTLSYRSSSLDWETTIPYKHKVFKEKWEAVDRLIDYYHQQIEGLLAFRTSR